MSEWKCPGCNKYLPVDHSAIKEGDAVNAVFIAYSQIFGRKVFRIVKAVVLSANETTLRVQPDRKEFGPVQNINRGDAYPIGAPTPLFYRLTGICKCKKDGEA